MSQTYAIHFGRKEKILLEQLARPQNQSIDSLIQELVLEALEEREDFYPSQLADNLYEKNTVTYGHQDAWSS